MSTTPTHRRPKHLFPVVLSILLVDAATAARAGAVTVGSLLCVTTGALENTTRLSCNFNGGAGGDGGLTGHIIIEEDATIRQATLDVVCTGPQSRYLSTLVDTYRETSRGRLTAGKDGDIVLLPSTPTARMHERAMTVLLNPIKT